MKLMKRTGIYTAANVTLDPETCLAYSYSWWRFVERSGGTVIFNNYAYSNTTTGHQYKVKHQMRELGIKIDVFLAVPSGLQAEEARLSSTTYYKDKIVDLERAMDKPRSHKAKNHERYVEICALEEKIKLAKRYL